MLNQQTEIETCEWCNLAITACEDRRNGTICPEYDDDSAEEIDPEIAEMMAETAKRAKMWEDVEAAGITIKHGEAAIVVGNAYRVRGALKRRGFRWDAQSKSWTFTTTVYYGFKMSGGRLMDCKIRRIPEPPNWIADVHAELFGR